MSQTTSRLLPLVREIRRRKLPAVAAAYTAIAYGVVELTSFVLVPTYVSEEAVARLLVLAVLGFPAVLAVCWYVAPVFELDDVGGGEGMSEGAASGPGPAGPVQATGASAAAARASDDGTTRLVVLPLRILRPDPETEFLAHSLPDAVTCSLASLDSLVVRTNVQGLSFPEPIDLADVATRADVNAVLTGTLMRAGAEVRVSVQLAEAPGGTVR